MNLIELIRIAGPQARLVSDSADDVAHVYVGSLTPSGRLPEGADLTCCRAHNRRLEVLPGRWSSLTTSTSGSVRLCARCVARLSSSCEGVNGDGRATSPVNSEDLAAAYAGVTVAELATALGFATTTEQTHRIGFLASRLHGPAPIRTTRNSRSLTAAEHALVDLNEAIVAARRRLAVAERAPDPPVPATG